ncbi:hypothetical protein MLD38_002052 [Melastoma candidum]|uniref:Uncharacterized protein n=1 Tax=Melastoma candidum TaxID=119954 RepID=A0ACB9SF72_9MYRT|nr:hypothetical protein MLD38_002052 [Melastoma candidum]
MDAILLQRMAVAMRGRRIRSHHPTTLSHACSYFFSSSTNMPCVRSVFANGFYGNKEAKTIGLRNAGHYLHENYGGGLFPILGHTPGSSSWEVSLTCT